MYDEAHKRATMKYLKNNDRIVIQAKAGTKERWQGFADREGVSLTKFIKDTVENKIKEMGVD